MTQYCTYPTMDLVESFPNRSLTPTEVESVRTHEDIALFIELDTPAEMVANGGTTSAVALARATLSVVTLGKTGWTQEVLKHEANRRDLLDEAFARFLR